MNSSSVEGSRFLDLRALASLEHMRFTAKQRGEGPYSGRHSSRSHGGAGEFVDYREYSPGEDLRHLDWKVLARTGKAYIRRMQDETNVVCTLALDASASMQFAGYGQPGSRPSKMEHAQYVATALSHVISRGQDQVGLGILTDRLESPFPPGANRAHVQAIQYAIEQLQTSPSNQLGPSLQELFQRMTRRGVLVLISDFLMDDLEETFSAIRLFRHSQYEVIILHLVDPDEERLPNGQAYRFEGLEGEGTIDCSPAEFSAEYERLFSDHSASIRALALANGCDYRYVSTALPYLQTVGQFLVERTG
jgi:uncharacterized protein (DUF58 family)